MSRINQDFTMWAGETQRLVVTVYDCDDEVMDITGSSISWIMQASILQGDPAIVKTTDDPAEIEITDGENGEFAIYLLPEDTENMGGWFYHEALLVDADDNESVVVTGRARINASVHD